MTNYDAVRGEIAPYTADGVTIEKALIDAGLNAQDVYSVSNRKSIAEVSICVLKGFLSLTSESEGSFSQSYDKAGLQAKMAAIAHANDISDPELSHFSSSIIRDKSNAW